MNYFYITGTSRGIGKAITKILLQNPENIITGISRNCSIEHPNYKHIQLDLNDLNKVFEFEFSNYKNAQSIVLINNAGILGDVKQVGKISSPSISETFNINTISPEILINKFIATYRNINTQKVVLNVGSGAGRFPIKSWSAYCASKAAIDMFSQVTFEEQKNEKFPIKIFSLAPGIIDTQMQDEIRSMSKEDFEDVDTFINYKETNQLVSVGDSAKQIIEIINNSDKYNQTILDAREL